MTKTTTKPAADPVTEQPPIRTRKRPAAKAVVIKTADSALHEPLSSGPNYTLESQNLIVEMNRLKDNALTEIISIETEQHSIHDRAQRDMQTIADRAKAEIDARGLRIADLKRSIALVDGGLSADPGVQVPPEAPIEQPTPPDGDVEDNEQ